MNIQSVRTRFNQLIKEGRLTYIAAICTVIVLSLHVDYLPPFMILWLIFWLIENFSCISAIYSDVKKPFKVLFFLFVSYYLWQVVGLIYSADLKLGLLNLFGRLSLLLFPIVLVTPGEMIKKRINVILRIFAAGTFVLMIFSFCYALFRSLHIQEGHLLFNSHPPEYWWLSYFYSAELVPSQHPSYISLYVLLSVFISFESALDISIKNVLRIFWFITGILLLVTIYFLSSRAVILSSLLLTPLYFLLKFRKHKKARFVWIGVAIVIIALMPLIVKNQRVSVLYNKFVHSEGSSAQKKEPRFIIWDLTLKLVRNNMIFGVGIGDVRDELEHEFADRGEELMARERYNVHNQFLEVLLENGIVGIILFISIFGCMGYIAFTDKNLLLGLYIFAVLFSFMFETLLYRFAGVSFFSLFSFALIHHRSNK